MEAWTMNPILEQICYGMVALTIIAIIFGVYCIKTAVELDENGNIVKHKEAK
jgi:hypothetical protein